MPRILRALRPEECCNQVRCQIAIFVGLVSATLSLLPFGFADPKGASVLSPKYDVFCCDQNGPPARRSEPDWRMEGAYLNRYVTDEQRSRRPIFIATKYLVFRGQDTSTRVRSSIVEGVTGFLNSPSFKDQTSALQGNVIDDE